MKQHKKNGGINPKYLFLALLAVCCVLIAVSFTWGTANNIVQRTLGTVIVPMQSGLNSIGSWISSRVEDSKTISELRDENEQLQLQVDTLKSQISSMENNLNELDELRQLLELKESYPNYSMVGARIISSDASNWYDTFTIDKGSSDGIQVDMNVIADNGLVGIVIETGINHSIVRSITDDASSVSAMDAISEDHCIVSGSLEEKDTGLLNVELIHDDAQIEEGNEIVTSYLSDKFLPGLTIGYITSVTEDASTLTRTAKVTPVVDFEHLRDVLVITQLKADLVEGGESSTSEETSQSSTSESGSDSTTQTQETDAPAE
ncbi:rod shape-determining protein MreC [Catenibacillus scindens]|uniref:Cell shape-determining protein MreC n=1 Tax=Catenibacillus scindens TaxID=673271 RepID=A0A7W8M4J5_9FIRM|nr:rod shape-determining protein MreC [Catenibacillus scindens]MBB5263662.1 rod shape-determining protein MreC [Catenibacillus scindens]